MRFCSRLLALSLAAVAFFAAASLAEAHQRVYADAYGNLIVISPSGYKQIIVGKGHLADELRAEIGEPEIIYYGRRHGPAKRHPGYGTSRLHRTDAVSCIPYGMVFKGRALMYGVNRGEAVYTEQYCR